MHVVRLLLRIDFPEILGRLGLMLQEPFDKTTAGSADQLWR